MEGRFSSAVDPKAKSAVLEEAKHRAMTTLREKLVKIGAKVVSHGRYVTFQLADVAVFRAVCTQVLRLIADLRAPPPKAA